MNWLKQKLLNIFLSNILKQEEVKKNMGNIKEFLQGKKTALVAIGAILGVIVAWTNGTMGDMEAIKAIVEALLALTIRAGIASTK